LPRTKLSRARARLRRRRAGIAIGSRLLHVSRLINPSELP